MTFLAGLIVCVVLAIWVSKDANSRGWRNRSGWIIGTLLLSIVFFPLYLAKRPLRAGEVRQGGVGWNFCKYLAIFWSVWLPIGLVAGSIDSALVAPTADEMAIGVAATIFATILVWIFVSGGALLLGLILRKSSVIEYGPSGQLSAHGWNSSGQGYDSRLRPETQVRQPSRMEPIHAQYSMTTKDTGVNGSGSQESQQTVAEKPESNVYEQIRRLAELRDEGLIAPEDFESKKQELLKRI